MQAGLSSQVTGGGPASGYVFYHLNKPKLGGTDRSLRLDVAPVYADTEISIPRALGPYTDVGFGFGGGGFADSFTELRRGEYVRSESFTGHGAGASASVYHRLNPGHQVPLSATARAGAHFATYEKDKNTARDFSLPAEDRSASLRLGLRMGGIEPEIMPKKAMEASLWYEGIRRANDGTYGFKDRSREIGSERYWARQRVDYTRDDGRAFRVNMIQGASAHADRFSAFRLGGMLPFTSEFPLELPGYSQGEISARRFLLFGGAFSAPFGAKPWWTAGVNASAAWVDYLPGHEEPGHWHAGVGADLRFRSPGEAWQFLLAYAYGIRALRGDGRGANSLGLMMQYDLKKSNGPFLDMQENPYLRVLREKLFGD